MTIISIYIDNFKVNNAFVIGTDNLLYSEYWRRTVLVYQLIFSHVLITLNNLHEQAIENINLTRLKNLNKRISLLHIQGWRQPFQNQALQHWEKPEPQHKPSEP